MDLVRDASAVSGTGLWYGYHADAHTSLVGGRELAARSQCFRSDDEVETWLQERSRSEAEDKVGSGIGLFAYPAQSNMNGRRLPLTWAPRLRASSFPEANKVFTLLDAAAYCMTAPLNLGDPSSAPDFIALSLYKIFGYPDLGALIVRKSPEISDMVRGRRYFGGGTVDMVTVMQDPWVARKETSLHAQLEDGTPPIHSILALGEALKVHGRLYGDMKRVSRHTCGLVESLYEGMIGLRHWNGRSMCVVYQDASSRYGDAKTQGPTVAFNLKNARGEWIGKGDVERLAILRGIHLRTGGLCNPGGIATHLHFTDDEMRRNFAEGVRCGNEVDLIERKPTGVVRVSLGAMSSMEDVATFLSFLKDLFLETCDALTMITGIPHTIGEKKVLKYRDGSTDFPSSSTLSSSVDASSEVLGCPVWNCAEAFASTKEFEPHLASHRAKGGKKLLGRLREMFCQV